ncbi:hypothetical protein D3C80_1662180 [compost metagenome]
MSLLSIRREVAIPVGIDTEAFDPMEPHVAVKKASGGFVYFNILFKSLGLLGQAFTSREVKSRKKVSLDVLNDPALLQALQPYGNPMAIHSKRSDLLEKTKAGNVIPWKRLYLQEYYNGDQVFYAPTKPVTVH